MSINCKHVMQMEGPTYKLFDNLHIWAWLQLYNGHNNQSQYVCVCVRERDRRIASRQKEKEGKISSDICKRWKNVIVTFKGSYCKIFANFVNVAQNNLAKSEGEKKKTAKWKMENIICFGINAKPSLPKKSKTSENADAWEVVKNGIKELVTHS